MVAVDGTEVVVSGVRYLVIATVVFVREGISSEGGRVTEPTFHHLFHRMLVCVGDLEGEVADDRQQKQTNGMHKTQFAGEKTGYRLLVSGDPDT